MKIDDIQQKIETALDEIRPFLLNDGGDISLVAIEGDVVKVRFLGACTYCDINKMTLTNGIEATIKKHVPHISQVVAVY